jgi:hypothetical protein
VNDLEALRTEFLRLLTEDSATKDRRRKEYNQAIFMDNGLSIWSQTTLDMVMYAFDRAVRKVK